MLVDPNAIILLTTRNYKLGMRPVLRGDDGIAFKAGTRSKHHSRPGENFAGSGQLK